MFIIWQVPIYALKRPYGRNFSPLSVLRKRVSKGKGGGRRFCQRNYITERLLETRMNCSVLCEWKRPQSTVEGHDEDKERRIEDNGFS